MDKLGKLERDISIEDFLQNEFPGDKYDSLKNSVRKYASGYDTADTAKASSFALRKEWQSEEFSQYRIKGGYGAMVNYLEEEFKKGGGVIPFKFSGNRDSLAGGESKSNYRCRKNL